MQSEKENIYLTKQKLLQHLSKKTGLSKKNIILVFDELIKTIQDHLKADGPGKFILPGILKMTTKIIPEQKERLGLNPFTKKEMIFKFKPSIKKIKIKALKNLRDLIN